MIKQISMDKLKINDSHKAVFELIYKFFIKTKMGPISFTLFPLAFMLMYFFVGNSQGVSFFISGLPSYLSLGILPITLVVLPQMLVEIKSSIILRKIAVSNLTKMNYIINVFLSYFVILILETIYVILLFFIFVNKDASTALKGIQWGGLIYGLFTLFISSIAFGILLGVIFNTSLAVQLCGFGIFFVTLLFSGQFVPIQVIGSVTAIKYISLASPLSYSLGLINTALVQPPEGVDQSIIELFEKGSNIFNLKNDFIIFSFSKDGAPPKPISIYATWHKGFNLVMPYVLCAGFSALSWKQFKWSNR
ncbi:MAG: ABC transporter permease [Mycoplasma sp.]